MNKDRNNPLFFALSMAKTRNICWCKEVDTKHLETWKYYLQEQFIPSQQGLQWRLQNRPDEIHFLKCIRFQKCWIKCWQICITLRSFLGTAAQELLRGNKMLTHKGGIWGFQRGTSETLHQYPECWHTSVTGAFRCMQKTSKDKNWMCFCTLYLHSHC